MTKYIYGVKVKENSNFTEYKKLFIKNNESLDIKAT